MHEIIVIGGGASGLTAAITAARCGGKVTILENNDVVGKKILSTGNGRCNLTNLDMSAEAFRGEEPSFVKTVLKEFDAKDLDSYLKSLGIVIKNRNGYVYPRNDQAASVRNALEMEVRRLGINLLTGVHVDVIKKVSDGFLLEDKKNHKKYQAKKVILACGSKASAISGSDGSGYSLARSLGHHITPVVPALVALRSPDKSFAKMFGVRTDAKVSLYVDGEFVSSDEGELQITNYGLSGIPVFQVSRYAAKALYNKKNVVAYVDFMPGMSENALYELLINRRTQFKKTMAEELLNSIFPAKLASVLLTKSNINKTIWAEKIEPEKWKQFAHICKEFKVQITDTNSFEQAQICAGGVLTKEVNPYTMKSRIVKDLYFTGELLDVDGICGGYNLHFAWASGYIAGNNIVGRRV